MSEPCKLLSTFNMGTSGSGVAERKIFDLSWSDDGNNLCATFPDHIAIYDFQTNKLAEPHIQIHEPLRMARFSRRKADSRYLYIAGKLRGIMLYDWKERRQVQRFDGTKNPATALVINKDESKLASASTTGEIIMNKFTDNSTASFTSPYLKQAVNTLSFSPFRKLFLAAGDEGRLITWDLTRPTSTTSSTPPTPVLDIPGAHSAPITA
ncbi:hypothetical protein HK102_009315, partial [Quaeritorhiza haematococci]